MGSTRGPSEYGETIEECAARELEEETGLKAVSLSVGPWTNNLVETKHYVTFFAIVDQVEGELQLREPHKCEEWKWFRETELPTPLFAPLQSFYAQQRSCTIKIQNKI